MPHRYHSPPLGTHGPGTGRVRVSAARRWEGAGGPGWGPWLGQGTAHEAGSAGPTVLVVDDEEALCNLIRDALARRGYKVLVATSGVEGVRLYREHAAEVQLVILDMVMPGMDGKAVFDALQAIDPGVRVLVSSGYMDEGTAASILRRGVAGFLRKPYTLRQLVDAVQAALGQTQ